MPSRITLEAETDRASLLISPPCFISATEIMIALFICSGMLIDSRSGLFEIASSCQATREGLYPGHHDTYEKIDRLRSTSHRCHRIRLAIRSANGVKQHVDDFDTTSRSRNYRRLVGIDQKVPARLWAWVNALGTEPATWSRSSLHHPSCMVVSSEPLAISHEDLQEANQNEVLPMSLLKKT
jgi:hypothetical protein